MRSCCGAFPPVLTERRSVCFSLLIVNARDLTEAAEGGELLGVDGGCFGGCITADREVVPVAFTRRLGYKSPMAVWSAGEKAMDMPLRSDNARALPTCPQPQQQMQTAIEA
jgi:hypothetical protein